MALNPIDVESLKKTSTDKTTLPDTSVDTTSDTPTLTTTDTTSDATTLPVTGTETIKTDYDIMKTAAEKIKDAVTNVNDILNEANKAVSDISNESTFYGPVADYCLQTWKTIETLTVNDTSSLNTASSTLNVITDNYNESDKKSGESVGGV